MVFLGFPTLYPTVLSLKTTCQYPANTCPNSSLSFVSSARSSPCHAAPQEIQSRAHFLAPPGALLGTPCAHTDNIRRPLRDHWKITQRSCRHSQAERTHVPRCALAIISSLFAEQLVDGKGTHCDEGDINAEKEKASFDCKFTQKCIRRWNYWPLLILILLLGSHVKKITVVLHHHLERSDNLWGKASSEKF